MDRTDEIIERLIRIEDNVCYQKKQGEVLRTDGMPRCATSKTQIENLEKTQAFFKKGLFSVIIGFILKITYDIFSTG